MEVAINEGDVAVPSSSISIPECDESLLLGLQVESDKKAFELYNDYAYMVGFGVRLSKIRTVYNSNKVKGREICCAKEGFKRVGGTSDKGYTKLDVRTGCKAKVVFEINNDGKWEVTKHDMIHNHSFCPRDKVHLLISHRKVDEKHLELLKKYVDSGVHVIDAFRFLRADAGGSPALGFTKRDAYNNLATAKRKSLNGCDCQALIDIFKKRKEKEDDFFYDFELDDEGRLVSFFWRDKQMKEDYLAYGKLLIFDTTYRTNKYKMICAPFVGMNHHTKNCMFGCGFVLN